MKKLISRFLLPTMITSLVGTTLLSNYNTINIKNNILNTSINKDVERCNDKNFIFSSLNIFIKVFLIEDCLTNFQKYYRLKVEKFKFLTYKDIIKEFELFLYKKYDIKFKVQIINNEEEEYFLINKKNIVKISISLFEINGKWIELNSDLSIHITLNDSFTKLFELKYDLKKRIV